VRLNGFYKLLAVACLIAALFYAATMLVGDDKADKTAVQPASHLTEEEKEGNTLVSIEGFRLLDNDFGKIRMEVAAKRAQLVNRRFRQFRLAIGNVVEMERPEIKINNDSGGKTVITSERATLDPVKKAVLFEGGCVVTTPGSRLRAESLAWKYSRGVIMVRGDYVLTKDGRDTGGRDISMDLGLGRIRNVL